MKRIIFIFPILVMLLALGCRKRPDIFQEKGMLDFSTDTVFFDTLFTGFDSPTERLIVRNNSGNNVKITNLKLESGAEYDMIFDGIPGDELIGYELADGDSAVVFISFTSGEKDAFSRDRVIFTVGDERQDVDIEAYIFDAVLLQDSLLGGFGGPGTTIFSSDKKWVIDGCLQVADGHTLIIDAGTQVYFTSRKNENFDLTSAIKVSGRLLVNGSMGNEVVFQQTRFGERYDETPGQWVGILFGNLSRSNLVQHALIKNGLVGIYQEFENMGPTPKVTLESVEIRNMAGIGILSNGFRDVLDNYPQIRAKNCLVHNCAEGNVVIRGGGRCEFTHCTFANYTVDFSRNSAQALVNNYAEVTENNFVAYPVRVSFDNCIIWGSEEEEFIPDSFPTPNLYDVQLRNTIVRTTLALKGSNIITSQSLDFPMFEAPTEAEPDERDYHLRAGSPAIGVGSVINGAGIDKDGFARDANPDLGCFEYWE